MARQGLHQHRKFLRLARSLGSKALARGVLEMLWEPAHDNGDDWIGDEEDLAARLDWDDSSIVDVLVECGFIDRSFRGEVAGFRIHDLPDHMPETTRRRLAKELERLDRGTTTRELLSAAGKKRAALSVEKAGRDKSGRFLKLPSLEPASHQPKAGTPSPSPSPSPSPTLKETSVEPGSTELVLISSEPRPDPAREVFDHWRKVMNHPEALFVGKRLRAVRARLKEGRTAEELKRAIDGCARTPHNMGKNDRGQRYDDLELICRDDSQVTRFMANAKSTAGDDGFFTVPHGVDLYAENGPKGDRK